MDLRCSLGSRFLPSLVLRVLPTAGSLISVRPKLVMYMCTRLSLAVSRTLTNYSFSLSARCL